jgi:hypothetical protein
MDYSRCRRYTLKKKDFAELVSAEKEKGGKHFCVSSTAYGEAVLHWTNEKGIRAWRILSGNRGRTPGSPSESTKKKIIIYRQWLYELTESVQDLKKTNEDSETEK